MLTALSGAFHWQRLLDERKVESGSEIARKEVIRILATALFAMMCASACGGVSHCTEFARNERRNPRQFICEFSTSCFYDDLVGREGIEPSTNGLKVRCSTTELPTRKEGRA